MDRFSILLNKPAPIIDETKETQNVIRIEIPSQANDGIMSGNGRVSAIARNMTGDQRLEGISIQTMHPRDGDLLIISLPLANRADVEEFREILDERLRNLNVHCEAMILNY